MKRLSSSMAVIACVAIGAGASGLALRMLSSRVISHPSAGREFELSRSDPRYDAVMCGPISLSIAMARVGITVLPAELATQCKVTDQGVAMRDLVSAAKKTAEISAAASRLTWDQLRRLEGPAVLFVKGSHYVAADPREVQQGAAKDEVIRIYDPGTPAQWWSREKLETVWTGESLAIKREQIPDHELADARIAWNECYIDQGVLPESDAIARYQFSLRNVGRADLMIDDIQKSCGCIEHSLSSRRIAPGDEGVIKVSVDLKNKEGYFAQYLYVPSNDPANPLTVLRMAGAVPRGRVVSSDLVRLEDLPQGSKTAKTVYIRDPGFNGFTIREVRFVPESGSLIGEHLSCVLSHAPLGECADRVSSVAGFRTTRTDYGLLMEIAAAPTCPLGPWKGKCHIVLDAAGLITTHKVAIEGRVVQDIHTVPSLALITIDPSGNGSATIQLCSRSKQAISVVKASSDSPSTLQIRCDGEAARTESKWTITAKDSRIIPGDAPVQRTVFFELENGTSVSVPVALCRLPER
jgi:Protein of unknown function (DUF1573)/Peptidase C39 family